MILFEFVLALAALRALNIRGHISGEVAAVSTPLQLAQIAKSQRVVHPPAVLATPELASVDVTDVTSAPPLVGVLLRPPRNLVNNGSVGGLRPTTGVVDEFEKLRRQNLEELAPLSLTVADLDRKGTHPTLGEVTLRQLLASWVAHDMSHVAQIARTLAERYRDDVGPWVGFMGIYRTRG